MKDFSRKVFLFVFATGLAVPSLYFGLLALIGSRSPSLAFNLLLGILGTVLVLAVMIGCYRYPLRWSLAAIRAVMRKIAKRAIRASLHHAMTRVECSGILEIDNDIALKVQAGRSQGVAEDTQFNVHESTSNQLWGSVVAINVREADCDCIVSDRANVEFWEKLEGRMRYNTEKPPNIHLIRELPITYLSELVENLLDAWR